MGKDQSEGAVSRYQPIRESVNQYEIVARARLDLMGEKKSKSIKNLWWVDDKHINDIKRMTRGSGPNKTVLHED